jgi:hypothetical protein
MNYHERVGLASIILAGNMIPIGWVDTAGPTTIYGSKDNNTRNETFLTKTDLQVMRGK